VLKLRLQTAARFPFPNTKETAQELLKRVRGGKLSAELVQTRHQKLEKGRQIWVLDERGKAWTSKQWADTLGELADQGLRELTLLVGAADGFGEDQRKEADQLISVSSCVLPSWLACLLCAEQIYRADTILRGTPYHRA
jgi:23S rRNA (pseudouridine1915-N3)-methyltransferase